MKKISILSILLSITFISACNSQPEDIDIINQLNANKEYTKDLIQYKSYFIQPVTSNIKSFNLRRKFEEPLPESKFDWLISYSNCNELQKDMGDFYSAGWLKFTPFSGTYRDGYGSIIKGNRCFVEFLDRANLNFIEGLKVDRRSKNFIGSKNHMAVQLSSDHKYEIVESIADFNGPGCTKKALVKYVPGKHYLSKKDPEILIIPRKSSEVCLIKSSDNKWLVESVKHK